MYRRQKTAVVGDSPFSSPPHSLSTALFKSSLFSLAARFRYKKIQDIYVNDSFLRSSDVAPCLTNSRSNMSPQPLPLPELGVLMRQDAPHAVSPSNNSANIRLPSPPSSKCREERDAHRHGNGDAATSAPVFGSKIASQDARRNAEHRESLASRRSPNKPGGAEKSPRNYRLNVPTSIPISSFSSPSLSPGNAGDVFTSHHLSPTGFQVWSAPELPPSDTIQGPGHSYQHYEINAIGADNYPLHNLRLNFVQHSISPRGPLSPLNTKLPADTSTTRRDGNIQNNVYSNTQTNVHPLPLPPTASMASQPASSSNVVAKPGAAKPERMKGQWKKGKLIGRGTFGSVFVGSNRETGALCAMKEVELLPDDPKSAECIRQLEQEIQVLSQLKHPNIVQYYGSETIGDRFYIYLEYVHPGSIVNYIRDHCGGITESIVRNFTRHILSGLAYLHSTKTIHRDIKGANLLVDAYGVVKLADFGMAKHLNGQAANLSLKGSPYWMAPELLQPEMQKDADPDLALAVDIWSLGCTIIEMMNGKPPWSEFEGAAAMFKVMRETPPIPETMSPEGKDFLCWCFRRNPAERPSASMLLEHRFMKNSQLLDVSLHNQALSGMKQMEKAHQLEHPKYKHDNVHVSTGAQSTKGKLSNSETDRKSSNETSELKVVPRRSLGSTMDAISSNPLGLGPHMDYPSPIAAAPGSIKPLVRVHRSQ